MFVLAEAPWAKVLGALLAAVLGEFVIIEYKKEYTGEGLSGQDSQANTHMGPAAVVQLSWSSMVLLCHQMLQYYNRTSSVAGVAVSSLPSMREPSAPISGCIQRRGVPLVCAYRPSGGDDLSGRGLTCLDNKWPPSMVGWSVAHGCSAGR